MPRISPGLSNASLRRGWLLLAIGAAIALLTGCATTEPADDSSAESAGATEHTSDGQGESQAARDSVSDAADAPAPGQAADSTADSPAQSESDADPDHEPDSHSAPDRTDDPPPEPSSKPQAEPAPDPSDDPPDDQRSADGRVELPESIVVIPDQQRVEVPAWTCLEDGFLEQVACSPGTREHESLVIVDATPSSIHAALLMAGFEAGRPGKWDYDHDREEFVAVAPQGSALDILVRYEDESGETVEYPIRRWITDHDDGGPFPDKPFIFAGSRFRENLPHMAPGEHYHADMEGSIVGIVTFGHEMVGYSEVISDRAAVHEPVWMVDTDAAPPLNTEVTLIFAPYDASRYDEGDAN